MQIYSFIIMNPLNHDQRTTQFYPRTGSYSIREAGLNVELRKIPVLIPIHGSGYHEEMQDTWIVENPHNGKIVLLRDIFLSYIEKKKQDIFLHEENKLNIINLFTK